MRSAVQPVTTNAICQLVALYTAMPKTQRTEPNQVLERRRLIHKS